MRALWPLRLMIEREKYHRHLNICLNGLLMDILLVCYLRGHFRQRMNKNFGFYLNLNLIIVMSEAGS